VSAPEPTAVHSAGHRYIKQQPRCKWRSILTSRLAAIFEVLSHVLLLITLCILFVAIVAWCAMTPPRPKPFVERHDYDLRRRML
jgi:hypothetical protein